MSRQENPSRLQKPPSYQQQQPYGSPPPQAYNGPAPPPQAYYPSSQQQGPFYNAPGMTYGPPQQQHILLGFINGIYQQKAIYGPPGASYDLAGNVYIDLGNDERSYLNRDAHDRYQKQRDKQWEKDLCRCQ